MNPVHADVEYRFLSRLLDRLFEFLLGLALYFFDSAGMNTAVGDELFQREPRNFTANRIVSRDHHGLRCIIDDEVDSGGRFERAIVSSLAPDDFSFHLVIGQRKYRYRSFRDKVAGEPFNGQGDNFLASSYRLLLGLLFNDANPLGRFVLCFLDHLIDQASFRFFTCQSCDFLQLPSRFIDLPPVFSGLLFDLLLPAFNRLVSFCQFEFALVERFKALIDRFFLTDQPAFLVLQLATTVTHLLFEFTAFLENAIFGVELRLFANRTRILFCFLQDPRSGFLRRFGLGPLLLGANPEKQPSEADPGNQSNQPKY